MTRDLEQPQVARLRHDDVNPKFETLLGLAGALWIEFTVDVRPANRKARLVTGRSPGMGAGWWATCALFAPALSGWAAPPTPLPKSRRIAPNPAESAPCRTAAYL